MSALPSIDSYWVIEDKFMAGAYPGAPDEETARRKVGALLEAGITCFVDLTYPGDTNYPYQDLLKSLCDEKGLAAEWLNFPILDYATPSVGQMQRILDTLDTPS